MCCAMRYDFKPGQQVKGLTRKTVEQLWLVVDIKDTPKGKKLVIWDQETYRKDGQAVCKRMPPEFYQLGAEATEASEARAGELRAEGG